MDRSYSAQRSARDRKKEAELRDGARKRPPAETGTHPLLSLQRSVGNQVVQRLLTVQRREDDLTLDETDFSPEQGRELDKGFRLTGEEGTEGEVTDDEHGQVDLESEGELVGEELDGRPDEGLGEDLDDKTQIKMRAGTKPRKAKVGPLAKLKNKLEGKSKKAKRRDPKGGVGWDVLKEIVGFPASLETAYQSGGAHAVFSGLFEELALAERWLGENQLRAAENTLHSTSFDKLLTTKLGVVNTLVSPIFAVRLVHLKGRIKQLRKQLERKKKKLGTEALKKPKGAPRPEDLDSGEGLDGEQLGGGF